MCLSGNNNEEFYGLSTESHGIERNGDIFTTVHMMMIMENIVHSIKYEVTFNEKQTIYNSQIQQSSHNNISLSPHILPRCIQTIEVI
jgi:hypothetical protein